MSVWDKESKKEGLLLSRNVEDNHNQNQTKPTILGWLSTKNEMWAGRNTTNTDQNTETLEPSQTQKCLDGS